MESNTLNYKFYIIKDNDEYSNQLNYQINYQTNKIIPNQNTIHGTYFQPNSNPYANSNPYTSLNFNQPQNLNLNQNLNQNYNQNKNIFFGSYSNDGKESFYSGNEMNEINLSNSSDLNQRLLSNSIELEYIIFLQIILVIVSEIYIGTIGIGWLLSYIIWLNKTSLIGILIYGFVINLMVGIMLSKIDLIVNTNIENTQNIQNMQNQNIFNKIISNRINLIWIITEFPLEKKIIILLFIVGISCFVSPILYILNQISWTISLSLLSNLLVGIIYLIKRLGEIKQNDSKELYQNIIPLDMIKINLTNTIFTGIIELIFNSSSSESIGPIKTFILIIFINLILFYIYWYQIKTIILDTEESYYYYANINIFNAVLVSPIKITKYISEFLSKWLIKN
jgi:F0F1-type ATP synthase assembly protein I